MSLRTEAIEAMAEANHDRWHSNKAHGPCYDCGQDAVVALDALLVFLTEHADEWADTADAAEVDSENEEYWDVMTSGLFDRQFRFVAKSLLTVLAGDTR